MSSNILEFCGLDDITDCEDPTAASPTTLCFENRPSIPVCPNVGLLADTRRLQLDSSLVLDIGSGQSVSYSQVLKEHSGPTDTSDEAFERYRKRLTWQIVKRRWFKALTDYSIWKLFAEHPPQVFVNFVNLIVTRIVKGIEAHPVLSDLLRKNMMCLVMKGGNVVTMMKIMALRQLPPEALKVLGPSMGVARLSDLDFLLYFNSWTKGLQNVEETHEAMLAVACKALDEVSESVQQEIASPKDFPQLERFVTYTNNNSEEVRSKLNASLDEVRSDVRDALNAAEMDEKDFVSVFQLLNSLATHSQAGLLPRMNMTIQQDKGVMVKLEGRPRHLYVSQNPDICFQDAGQPFNNHFSLVRGLFGFGATYKDFVLGCKAEGIDISIPKKSDFTLQGWCKKEPCFRAASLKARKRLTVSLSVESLETAIDEQVKMTFGARMSAIEIWKIFKVTKRLGRLVELLGIRTMTLRTHNWGLKAKAWHRLSEYLSSFLSSELPRAVGERGAKHSGGSPSSSTSKTSPLTPRSSAPSRHSLRTPARLPSHPQTPRAATRVVVAPSAQPKPPMASTPHVKKAKRTPQKVVHKPERAWFSDVKKPSYERAVMEIWEESSIESTIVRCLDTLKLRVFQRIHDKTLFLDKWREILDPIIAGVKVFACTFDVLHSIRRKPSYIPEESLYKFSLGSSWDIAPAPTLPSSLVSVSTSFPSTLMLSPSRAQSALTSPLRRSTSAPSPRRAVPAVPLFPSLQSPNQPRASGRKRKVLSPLALALAQTEHSHSPVFPAAKRRSARLQALSEQNDS